MVSEPSPASEPAGTGVHDSPRHLRCLCLVALRLLLHTKCGCEPHVAGGPVDLQACTSSCSSFAFRLCSLWSLSWSSVLSSGWLLSSFRLRDTYL